MVPLALGSQTVGSTLRPAAYCGIVGLKPTYGRVSCAGVIPLAWSFDTLGVLARSVADAALGLAALAGYDPADLASVDAPGLPAAVAAPTGPPSLGFPRRFAETAPPETVAHLEAVAERCRAAGAAVRDVELPPSLAGLAEARQRVLQAEAAAYHAEHYPRHAEQYRERFREVLAAGSALGTAEYLRAVRHCRRFRRDLETLLSSVDALVLPVAPGPAPAGLALTGDASFCAPWSAAGVPALALPSGVSAAGLPLGIQLVGAPWQEAALLVTARWIEGVLAFQAAPPLP
jgi:amidase